MKIIYSIFFIAGMIACTSAQQSETIAKNIDAKIFKQKIEEQEGLQLVDVRTAQEQAYGVIEGADRLDFSSNNFESSLEKLNKNKPVLVYCASGGRSGRTMQKLKKMGFKEVYNLQGGIQAWIQHGYAVDH